MACGGREVRGGSERDSIGRPGPWSRVGILISCDRKPLEGCELGSSSWGLGF